jgi:flagellar hook-length control protein FliK
VSGVVSEAGAVRHAHPGRGPRSDLPPAEPADETRPFASLLDGTNDTPPPAASPPPAAPPPPSQKPAPRAQDGRAPQPSPETAATPQILSSDSPAPATQAGAVSPPPAKSSPGTDSAQAVLALDAVVKAAAVDTKSTINANADAAPTNSAADASAGNTPVDPTASSTAAAVTDIHGDKTAKPDPNASDAAQLTIPPGDPSAGQPIPAAPPPVAVAIAAPATPAPATTVGSGNGSDRGQDDAQIAALGDAVKAGALSGAAGALSGKADRSGAQAAKNGSAPTGSGAGGSAKPPDGRIAGAAESTPAPAGPGQPDDDADGLHSRVGDAVAATPAGTDRTGQRAVTNQPADGTAVSQPDGGTAAPDPDSNISPKDPSSVDLKAGPNADPKRDPAAPASRVEDITRQALETAVRRSEAPAADAGSGGASGADSALSGGTQPSPEGGLMAPAAPALTTSAAPTAAPATNVTPTTVPIAGLAVEIAAHAHAGKNRFEIRLDPPDLGRIDVRLDVDRDGKVTSRLVVERPQTLDMLRRDAPELERSLQQAGLKTADNALQFSLRDQGGFGSQNPYSNTGSPAGAARVIIPDRDMPSVDAAAAGYGRASGASTGLDIRV